jgi:HD-GYP domain-containing protein (c-di-GMP phosphodiesterase class II)
MLGATLAATGVALLRRMQAARMVAARLLDEASHERDLLREELRRREVELLRRHELIERLQRGRRAEREWNRELSVQLQREHGARGRLVEQTDARDLVLRAAIELVEAEKGLLLSRRDADGDGRLDLVFAHGFDHDPSRGVVVQRFAREVLERDRIVREDAPPAGDHGADAEIENLVAIPLYLLARFQGVIVCANRDGGFEALDDDVLIALGDHASAALHNERLQSDLNHAHRAATRMLADAVDARDPVLRLQAGEAALVARALCRRLGLGDRELEVIATAAIVRDVGHIAVPERILLTPGPLSPDERTIMELHPRVGAKLIAELPALQDVAATVLHHHERVDGTGYPAGLAGEAIPHAARVLAVVDAYSAMIHDRPYRSALSPEEALAELGAGAGTQFDPAIVGALVEEVGASTAPHPELAAAVASAMDTAGLPALRELTGTDPLTLLPGHRAFREAAAEAATDYGMTVAMVQLEDLDRLNRVDGYAAGDHALLIAARAAQLAAARVGGRVYRDSGRRVAVLVGDGPDSRRHDLAAELHTEFAIGPRVRVGVAHWQSGDTGEDVIARARDAMAATASPDRD